MFSAVLNTIIVSYFVAITSKFRIKLALVPYYDAHLTDPNEDLTIHYKIYDPFRITHVMHEQSFMI